MKNWLIKKLGGYSREELDYYQNLTEAKTIRRVSDEFQREVQEYKETAYSWEKRYRDLLGNTFRLDFTGEIQHWRESYQRLLDKIEYPVPNFYSGMDSGLTSDRGMKSFTIRWDVQPQQYSIIDERLSQDGYKEHVKEYVRSVLQDKVFPSLYYSTLSNIDSHFKVFHND